MFFLAIIFACFSKSIKSYYCCKISGLYARINSLILRFEMARKNVHINRSSGHGKGAFFL